MAIFKHNSKTKMFPQTPHTPKKCSNSIKRWFLKWDRNIAAFTAVLIFFVVLGVVIFNIITKEKEEVSTEPKSIKMKSFLVEEYNNRNSCQFITTKTLSCSNAEYNTLQEAINTIIKDHYGEGILEVSTLVLTSIAFNNGRIDKGWLDNISLRFQRLTIKNSLEDIGEGALSGGPFQNYWDTLTLINTNIKFLKRNMFVNSKMKYLAIYYDSMTPLLLEEKAFNEVSRSLENLQLQYCIGSSEALVNATGSKANEVLKISMLSLEDSSIEVLSANALTSVPYLKTLYIARSNIKQIEMGAFEKQTQLERLDLRWNLLKTLPQGIFDSLYGKPRPILIGYNPWNCSCDFVWFYNFFHDNSDLFSDEFYCKTPWDGLYTKEPFCPDDQNTTTISSSSSETFFPTMPSMTEPTTRFSTTSTSTFTTDPSYPPDQPTIPIECNSSEKSVYDLEITDYITVYVRNATVQIHLGHLEEDTYELQVEGDVSKNLLLWFNSKDSSRHGCKNNLGKTLVLNALQNGETYTFCLLDDTGQMISPFDCTGVTIPRKWEDQTWIPNKMVAAVVSAICVTLLAVTAVSCLVMFCCIRQHPQLIKGNDRVVVIPKKKRTAESTAAPKSYEEINYIPPSFNTNSAGYLTPVNPNYEQARSDSRVRTVSGNTITSIPSVYPCTMNRVKKRQISSRVHMQHVSHAFEDHVYEPPPLPPNHPTEWIYSNSSGVSYSRV